MQTLGCGIYISPVYVRTLADMGEICTHKLLSREMPIS